jgi:hypothetical protein
MASISASYIVKSSSIGQQRRSPIGPSPSPRQRREPCAACVAGLDAKIGVAK